MLVLAALIYAHMHSNFLIIVVMQALTQAVAAGAPYALLTDGFAFVFLFIQAQMCSKGKEVIAWRLQHKSMCLFSKNPTVFGFIRNLVCEEAPTCDWPTVKQMHEQQHRGCPLSYALLNKLTNKFSELIMDAPKRERKRERKYIASY